MNRALFNKYKPLINLEHLKELTIGINNVGYFREGLFLEHIHLPFTLGALDGVFKDHILNSALFRAIYISGLEVINNRILLKCNAIYLYESRSPTGDRIINTKGSEKLNNMTTMPQKLKLSMELGVLVNNLWGDDFYFYIDPSALLYLYTRNGNKNYQNLEVQFETYLEMLKYTINKAKELNLNFDDPTKAFCINSKKTPLTRDVWYPIIEIYGDLIKIDNHGVKRFYNLNRFKVK
jgi:hypothetical protein